MANNNITADLPPMSYADALEDVHTRFILNLPDSELQTADRIFFQIEQAWWFYEDLICDPRPESDLPRYPNFKPFARMLFEYSPLLPDDGKFNDMWVQFSVYKRQISNYGCILMSADHKKIILCQVYNGKSFMLPAGKINQGENGQDAAARETYEETGFDPSCTFGLTAEWKETAPHMITWSTELVEQNMLVQQDNSNGSGGGKRRTSYVVSGVPADFPFAPVARKEVDKVAWYSLDDIPKPNFGVIPFLAPLRNWIKKQKKKAKNNKSRERGKKNGTPKSTPSRSRNNNSRGRDSRGKVRHDSDDLVTSGLASTGDASGWSEGDMFKANEKILGRKVEYDGNPHDFCEQGLSKGDPHSFRVVGGTFLNSEAAVASLAPPPDRSRLQPLFRREEVDTVEGLTPFFSDDGATPWGEVVQEAKVEKGGASKKKSKKKKNGRATAPATETARVAAPVVGDEIFLTDAQITKQSQEKAGAPSHASSSMYEEDIEFVRQHIANLPKSGPTKYFGTFLLDADTIMAQAERDVKSQG